MFSTPPLPYDLNALAPTMSAPSLEVHHGAHHAAYIKKTNAFVKQHGLAGEPLEEVVRRAREIKETAFFNQAGQAWNHAFFWNSMAPRATRARLGDSALKDGIKSAFGGFDAFRDRFLKEGEAHFASGWIWLVAQPDGVVAITTTHDADTPIAGGEFRPLAVCDLWEHAYYLDYQNERGIFLQGFIDALINWDFAESQYAAALKGVDGWRHPLPEA